MKKILCSILLLFLVWASITGQYIGIIEDNLICFWGFRDFVIITIIMMIIPFIFRIVNRKKLEINKGKRICKFNSIVLFILSIFLSVTVFSQTGFVGIGGLGAFVYYYINKWIFVTESVNEDKILNTEIDNSQGYKKKVSRRYKKNNISKFITYIIIGILIVICIIILLKKNNIEKVNSTTENNNIVVYDRNEYSNKENCKYEIDVTIKKIEIAAESSSGVGDVFAKMDSNLENRIYDNVIGQTYDIIYKLTCLDEDCQENWYFIKLDNEKEGYVWGGYKSMYVNEIE